MPAEADHEARYKLADALARNPGNKSAAARVAGYNRRQVHRLLSDPEFLRMLEAAKGRLEGGGGPIVADEAGRKGARYLEAVVDGLEEPDPNRINAAKALVAAAQGGKRPPARVEKPPEVAQEPKEKRPPNVVDLAKWRKA